ncbi:MAG TPA: hypothetical protein VFA07_17580 [Chthonomonadaceae bacterium]|nr:hypothetical protein [Chthonomonadaceae bacterium]
MVKCKTVLIGAGSFVFGPSMLSQLLLEHRLDDLHLALVDVDGEVAERMAGVGRRMARETGVTAQVHAHTDRCVALPDADFVICSAAPQMQRRFQMDVEIIDRLLPGHLVSEFGGVAGISYSLRQIAMIESIAEDMRRLCPSAWLLNVANPLPRVCQAAHERGIRTAGFCSVSLVGYGMLERIFTGRALSYPFTAAREKWQATMAGTNHLSWLIDLRDRASGADLMPALRQQLAEGATSGNPRAEALAHETGYLLMPGDDHTKDFLVPQAESSRTTAWHGSPDERERRLRLLKDIGEGHTSWDELLAHPAWERPGDLIAALAYGRPTRLHSLNLVNTGQIPNLPCGVFVETPATCSEAGPQPQTVPLPESVQPFCASAAQVTAAIVRAARERRLTHLHEAVDLDPTILDKPAGKRAIDACLRAHADLLPIYR